MFLEGRNHAFLAFSCDWLGTQSYCEIHTDPSAKKAI